jgi:hypothetical protein
VRGDTEDQVDPARQIIRDSHRWHCLCGGSVRWPIASAPAQAVCP